MTETANPILAEVWRGDFLESVHRGTAVVCTASGEVVEAWGDPARVILPRSSCKVFQALPLVESGAADAAGLAPRHLALACASHEGAAIHTDLAAEWLAGLGLGEPDLRCGAHAPYDGAARRGLRARGERPCQFHNNCSGKHSGMLTLNRHLGGGPDYVEPDHPVQRAIRQATAEIAGEDPAGFAIDGCSAPNFALSLRGFATGLARAATGARPAGRRLAEAMMAHPDLVAGEGRACTLLMRAAGGHAAVKTGAEAVFAAMLPGKGLGIALKIDDGSTRGSEAAMTALLVRHGAIAAGDPVVARFGRAEARNWRGLATGRMQAAASLW